MTDSVMNVSIESNERRQPLERSGSDERFGTLLLPIARSDADRIESLAATASETGGMLRIGVKVLDVFSSARFKRMCEKLEYTPDESPTPDEIAKRITSVREMICELATPLWEIPMDVEGWVNEVVSDEIVVTVEDINAKRIVIGGRRRTPTGKAVFSSTAKAVLLNAPCPVTVVRDT